MVMTSRLQGIQDRLVQNGQKVAQKGSVDVSSIPAEIAPGGSEEFIPDQKPIDAFQMLILKALNTPSLEKHIYAGTADPVKVAKSRAKNKVARKQRRVNRGH